MWIGVFLQGIHFYKITNVFFVRKIRSDVFI